MTQTFASTALPVQAAQGGLGASVLIHLSGLQARKLGLQPGQLLHGEVKPGSSGPDLLIAGISVPLPVGATVGAGGALTVQALLMRGGWILRSLTGEHTEQLVRTGSAPSGLVPSGSVPSGSVLSGPAPSGPGSAPAVSPQTAGVSARTPMPVPVERGLMQPPASWLNLMGMTGGLSPAATGLVDARSAALAGGTLPTDEDWDAVSGWTRPAVALSASPYQSVLNRSVLDAGGQTERRAEPLPVAAAAVSLEPSDSTYPALRNAPTQTGLGSTGLRSLTQSGSVAAPGLSADASKAYTAQTLSAQPMGLSQSTPIMKAHPGAVFDGRAGHFTPAPQANLPPAESIGEPTVLGIDAAALASRPIMLNPDLNSVRMSDPVARDLGLRDGAIVQGAVKADGDALKLFINGLPIALPDGQGLTDGDTPTFRVFQSPEGLLLQPLRTPPAVQPPLPPVAPAVVPALANNNLLSLLLHPSGLSAMTQLLSGGTLEKVLSAFAPELTASLRLGRLSMARLTSASLRKAVAESGLWAEASMAQGKAPLEHDTKLLLLKLMKESSVDSTAKQVLGRGLEDIESAQLQAVQAQANHELVLNLVLPFADSNPVRLSFHRPAPSREQPNPPYTVNIHSRNEILGEVWLKTAITDNTQVDMTMWARRPEVAAAANKGSQTLAMELERAGLKMSSFVIYNGARQEQPTHFAESGALVNLQA